MRPPGGNHPIPQTLDASSRFPMDAPRPMIFSVLGRLEEDNHGRIFFSVTECTPNLFFWNCFSVSTQCHCVMIKGFVALEPITAEY